MTTTEQLPIVGPSCPNCGGRDAVAELEDDSRLSNRPPMRWRWHCRPCNFAFEGSDAEWHKMAPARRARHELALVKRRRPARPTPQALRR